MSILDYIERIKRENESPRITAQEPRNMYAGGQLVRNTVDGSRPGYSGVYKRQEKPGHAVKWRIRGERGGVDSASWLKERGYETTFTSKAEAEKVNKLFNEAVTQTKGDITTANWMKEGKKLAEEFNAKVLKDFTNKNMSNTASWKKFLEGKKLKHAGVDHYKSKRVVVGAMDSHIKKYELADILIDDATKNLKYTDWMDIQKKLTKGPNINFKSFRKHIDKHNKLNSPSVKANQAFDYLLNNNVSMEIPKKLPLSLQGERGNLLRKVIHDLTGVGVQPIIEGLNANKNYKNYKKLVQFADHSGLWKESAGKTFKEIMDVADHRVGGSVSWSYGTTKKIAKDANGSVFDFAKRHWNYHMKNQTGDTRVKFYWKNKFDANGKPLEIDWEKVPKNKSSVKSIKPTEVFFRYKNPETGLWGKNNWSMSSLRSDGLKSGLFTEVYDAKKAYDTLLSTPVTNPFKPDGNKIRFGQLMKKAFKEGFDDLSISPYAMEHGAKGLYGGVNELPFNNIKIATTRVNGALNALDSMSKAGTINKNVTKIILNELSQNVFDPYSKTFVNDIETAGQKLATGVAEGTIYEPKKTELNILGESVIQKSKDFTKLPSKTQTGLLHVAGIDLSKPEGRSQLNKLIKTAKTAKGPGRLKALNVLLATLGAGGVYELGFSPTEVQAAEAEASEAGAVAKKSIYETITNPFELSFRDRAKIFGTAVAGDVIVKKGALTKASMKALWKGLPFAWTPMGDVLIHKFLSGKEPVLEDFAEGFKEAGYDINSEEFKKAWNIIPEEERKEILYGAAGKIVDKRSTGEKIKETAASPWTHAQYAFWKPGVESMQKLLKANPGNKTLAKKLALRAIRMGIPMNVIKALNPIGWGLTGATLAAKVYEGSEPQAFYKDGENIFKGMETQVLPSMISEYEKKWVPEKQRDKSIIDYSLPEGFRKDPDDLKTMAQRNRNTTPHFLDWALQTPLYKKYQEENKSDGGRAGYMGGGITGIRRPNAIAPTGGPMSQGLRSLYINDRDY